MSTPRSPSIQSQPVSVDSFGRLDYVPVAKRSISGSASQQSEQSKEELVSKQEVPIVTRSRRGRIGTKNKLKCDVGPSSPLAPGFEYVEAIRSHRISDEDKSREFRVCVGMWFLIATWPAAEQAGPTARLDVRRVWLLCIKASISKGLNRHFCYLFVNFWYNHDWEQ